MHYETTFDRKTGLFDTHRVDLNAVVSDFAANQLAALKLDAAAQADSARRYMDMRKEPPFMCQNCGNARGTMFDASYPVAGNPRGWVCQRCHELCGDCGNHPPTEGHASKCERHPDNVAAAEAEAWEAGREERLQDAELRVRGIF